MIAVIITTNKSNNPATIKINNQTLTVPVPINEGSNASYVYNWPYPVLLKKGDIVTYQEPSGTGRTCYYYAREILQ